MLRVLCFIAAVAGSHFRFGTISWRPGGGNTVTFQVDSAWRRDYPWDDQDVILRGNGINGDMHVVVGDEFTVPSGSKGNKWYYGDGTDELLQVLVTAPNPSDTDPNYKINNALGKSIRRHTYATPQSSDGGSWRAGFFGCCRLGARPDGDPVGSTADGLNNNGDTNWDVKTSVDLTFGPSGSQDTSPFSVGRAILRLRSEFLERFDIVAVDLDDDELTWAMGKGDEMGSATNQQPGWGANQKRDGSGPLEAKNKMNVENVEVITDEGDIVRIGEAVWDTHGVNTGYWQSTVMIHGNKAKIPYDFLILLRDAMGNEPPVWMSPPTPTAAGGVKVTCPGTVTYTLQADDPQKGSGTGESAVPADNINIFLINPPPAKMSHGKQVNLAPADKQDAMVNPVKTIASWGVSCVDAGKYVVCYQAEDDNRVQPLDSRVRCVVITVTKIENKPPVFCEDTPKHNEVMGVCADQAVSFNVVVCDENDSDEVSIDFTSGVPEGAEVTEIMEYLPAGSSKKNKGRKTFRLNPSQSMADTMVCFEGSDNHAEEPLKTGPRCVVLSIRYPPRWISPSPIKAEGASNVMGHVCSEIKFTIMAADKNAEDDVTVFVEEDPGVPPGAIIGPNVCPAPLVTPEGAQDQSCNPVHRVFTWTPIKGQEGKVYKVCFSARDNKDNCEVGGFWAMELACVNVEVTGPSLEWTGNAGEGATAVTAFTTYVGCKQTFDMVCKDPHYCVTINDNGDMPAGASLAPCKYAADSEGARQCEQCSRTFSWTPARGQEAASYSMSFSCSDDMCDQTGHDGVLISSRPAMATISRSYTIQVMRCKYCVGEGDTLHYITKHMHLDTNWLRLWVANGNDDDDSNTFALHNPDELMHSQDVINVGPVYAVQAGDTMVSLAARFHTTVKKIMSVNPDVTGKDDVSPGQHLCLMPCTDAPTVHSNTYKYAY